MPELPKLKNSGCGVVQVGQAGGDVEVVSTTINHHYQHTHHHHRHTHHHGPVHINTVVVQPGDAFALQAPSAPPAHRSKHRRGAAQITPAQKELLTLMKPLPAHVRIQVLDFMRCEFGTGLVMELEPRELHQTRLRVLDARRAAGV